MSQVAHAEAPSAQSGPAPEASDPTGRAPEAPEPGVSLRYVAGSVALSAVVLAVIAAFTFDLSAFAPFAARLNPLLLGLAVLTVVVRVGFGAWRLHHYSEGRIGARGAVESQIVWDFFAYVTPSTVGGGPFAAVYISRDQRLPLGEATSVILFAMLVDQIWFALTIPALLLCAVYVDVFPQTLGTAGTGALLLFFAGYLAWVGLLAYGTLVRPDRLAAVVGGIFRLPLLRRVRDRVLVAMTDMAAQSRALRAKPLAFHAKGAAITLVPWLCRYALAVFVIASVFPAADGLLVFLRSAAMQLGALAVPTPGGAGGVEALYLLFLGPPLLPQALVAPTLLVWRLLSFYVFIAAGVVLVARHVRRQTPARQRPLAPASHLPTTSSLPSAPEAPLPRS